MSTPSLLGSLIAADAKASRDAIHVAIMPLQAAEDLRPGEPFLLNASGGACAANRREALGIVDPFLKTSVRPGERFYGLLSPGSTTNLRHDFDHHAFPPAAAQVVERIVEKPEDPEVTAVREFARDHGLSLQGVIEAASDALNDSCRGCN